MKIDWQKMDGLIPCVVQDELTRRVLMVAYMNEVSLQKTQETGNVTFFSRSRQQIWTKGETSGNFLKFVSLSVDCDGDALLVQARPLGPVCHTGEETCFFESNKWPIGFLNKLEQVIENRFASSNEKESYVSRLIQEGEDRVVQKVGEEAIETVIAAKNTDMLAFENEAADLLFHLMVLLRFKNSSLEKVVAIFEERHQK